MNALHKTGTQLIAEERQRQIAKEGWSLEHDDQHEDGELEKAGKYYLATQRDRDKGLVKWPWNERFLKLTPAHRVRELMKGGALLQAAKDRIDRVLARGATGVRSADFYHMDKSDLQELINGAAFHIDYLLSASQDWFNSAKDTEDW